MRVLACRSCLTLVPWMIVLSIAVAHGTALAVQAVNRTVYVTVTDAKDAAVTDLTPANFKVKEGGKDREIVKAEPAKARPRRAADRRARF